MSLAADERDLTKVVRQRIEAWRSGCAPDAAALLDEYPALRRAKSLVLDLALEEYCLRTEAGDRIAASTFCKRFGAWHQSIARLLEVHELLDRCPAFAAKSNGGRWPLPGDHLAGFDILEPLGRGSLARVYLAREVALGGRHVVLKISRYGAGEAATLGRLSHPNIVPIHSVRHDELSGWTIICMPLLGTATCVDLLEAAFAGGERPRSGSVVARVARQNCPVCVASPATAAHEVRSWNVPYGDAVARIGWELAGALEEAHRCGVLHRDIKPSNILLSWLGRPMLLDFNLSSDEAMMSGRAGGTLAYMAPEAIQGLAAERVDRGLDFDPRSDVYSLGVVLYELLTGRLPVAPPNVKDLPPDAFEPWLACKQLPASPLRGLAPDLDPRLEAIVLKCLAQRPEDRYCRAGDLAAELAAYLGPAPSARRFVRRNRRAFLIASTCALLPLGRIAYYLGTRPPYHARLLETGLTQYQRGQYRQAAETFTRCLAIQPGWPVAHFARGQALRKQRRWPEARADFVALDQTDKGWAYGLAGFCSLSAGNKDTASRDFELAYQSGLRDPAFLLNAAYVASQRGFHAQAIAHCNEVLAIDPQNKSAIRCRAEAHKALAMQTNKLPHQQAFDDARRDVALHPGCFEAAFRAAHLFGFAATKDRAYRDEAVRYLEQAIRNGLPRELIEREPLARGLLGGIDKRLLASAPARPGRYRFVAFPIQEPPDTPDLAAFLRQAAIRAKHDSAVTLAANNP